MKIFKKIFTIIVTIILIIVLSYNIFNFISIRVLGNKLPTINGYSVLEIISGSMEPKFKIGDLIVIDTKITKFKEKDIVTFKDVNGEFVTHRIIEINEDEIITKGDNNNTIDEAIEKEDIVGRYIYKLDGIGALMKSLRSPFVLIMILLIGILLCILVSTDSKGNAILSDEEKEYIEFLEYKNNKQNQKEKNKGKKEDINKKVVKIKKEEPVAKKTKKTTANKTNNKDSKKDKTIKKEEVTKEKIAKKSSPSKKKTTTKPKSDKKDTTKNIKSSNSKSDLTKEKKVSTKKTKTTSAKTKK